MVPRCHIVRYSNRKTFNQINSNVKYICIGTSLQHAPAVITYNLYAQIIHFVRKQIHVLPFTMQPSINTHFCLVFIIIC